MSPVAQRSVLGRGGTAIAAVLLLGAVALGETRATAANVDIGAFNFQFAPNDSTATVGDQATFTNGGGSHSAVAVGGTYPAISLGGGQSGSWQLTAPGTVWYYCGIHANASVANEQGLASGAMVGRIVVTQDTPTATPVPPTATPPPPTATATATNPQATATPAPATETATATPTARTSATATPTGMTTTTPLPPDASTADEDDGSSGPLMGFVAGGLALAAVGGGVYLALRLRRFG